jgi:hypothetical protein
MIDKSPVAIAERRKAFEEACAIAALEGIVPDAFDLALNERVTLGEISCDEASMIIRERFTRHPEHTPL